MQPQQKLTDHGQEMLTELGRQVIDISAKYHQYKILYVTDAEDTATINRAAEHFFDYIGESLMRDIMLSIARLCDPAKTGSNDNLTFDRLADELPEPYKQRCKDAAAALLVKIGPVKTWRHKHIAHNDLSHSLRVKSLPLVQYALLTECVKDAVKLLNIVECDYKGEIYMHYDQVLIERGADKLITYLKMQFSLLDAKQAEVDKAMDVALRST